MPVAVDKSPLPELRTGSQWKFEWVFEGVGPDDRREFPEGSTFAFVMAPEGFHQPEASRRYTVTDITSLNGAVLVIIPGGTTAAYAPGKYVVDLILTTDPDDPETLYSGTLPMSRGLTLVSEEGGGVTLPSGGVSGQRIISPSGVARVVAGYSGGAAIAADLANTAGAFAQEQGEFAQTKGSYASEKGDYAQEQGAAAETVVEGAAGILSAVPVVKSYAEQANAVARLIYSGPSFGFIPGTAMLAAAALLMPDGKPVELQDRGGLRWQYEAGAWQRNTPDDFAAAAGQTFLALAPIKGGPSFGFIPGTTDMAVFVEYGEDLRPRTMTRADGTSFMVLDGGPAWGPQPTPAAMATLTGEVALARDSSAFNGPSFGFAPGTEELVVDATLDSDDGRPFRVVTNGSPETPGVTVYSASGGGFRKIAGPVPTAAGPVAADPSAFNGPSFGFAPGTSELVLEVVLDSLDGRPFRAITNGGPAAPGLTIYSASSGEFVKIAGPVPSTGDGGGPVTSDPGAFTGPSFGFVPGTAEIAIEVILDSEDDRPFRAISKGPSSAPGLTYYAGSGGGFVKVVGPATPASEPAVFDAASATVPVPAGSVSLPGRFVAWPAGTVTSPATASVAVTNEALNAGVNQPTWLAYETVLSVASVTRTSDSAAMVLGTDYTLDMSRGFLTNLTGAAMRISYTGSASRKDVISVDPKLPAPVLTLTQGTEKPRNAHLYPPALPAGHMEVARVTRKGSRALFLPRWKWRNGVHLDRLAEEADALDYNRRILAPIVARLIRGDRVRVISHGNSRVSMTGDPNYARLNVNPNSQWSADPAERWARDVPSYYSRYGSAEMALFGFDVLEEFDATPGYNVAGSAADGWGAYHVRGGYVWELLKQLHRLYPEAIIEYRNWSIHGTDSSATISGDGRANAMYPARWDAVKADIVAGETLYIPMDPMNELGSTSSYGNWVALASAAQALGAVVHFMGAARPDPRWSNRDAAYALSCAEMARAAWDTGSALSDTFRLLSPANLCGLGLHDDEMMDATLQNHEGVPLQRAIGLDAARSYSA